MKSISPPDLTALALNELPPDAAAELTRLLAESPAEAAAAEETRAFCALLSQTLATPEANEGGGLSVAQKQIISENLPPRNLVRKHRWPLWAGAGAAAAVAAWLAWPQLLGSGSRVVATSSSPPSQTETSLSLDASTAKVSAEYKLSAINTSGTATARSSVLSDQPDPSGIVNGREEVMQQSAAKPLVASHGMTSSSRAASDGIVQIDGTDAAGYSGGKEARMLAEDNRVVKGPVQFSSLPAGSTSVQWKSDVATASPQSSPTTPPLPLQKSKSISGTATLADGYSDAEATLNVAGRTMPAAPLAAPAPATAPAMPAESDYGTSVRSKQLATLSQDKSGPQTRSRQNDVGMVTGGLAKEGTREQEAMPTDRLYSSVDEYRHQTEPVSDLQQTTGRFGNHGAESYIAPPENPFRLAAVEPLSTFSIDVDTASYANVRRFLNQGQRPPGQAVRVEELVNYFRYAYPAPEAGKPCSLTADLVICPWNEHHRLARVALKARTDETRPKANLVFLIDVSGSMNEPNKLPLVKQSLKLLVDKLSENDRVAIVVYAGASGLVLPPTHGENKKAILGAIDNLQPGGSTNGAGGITLAYTQARKEFLKEGVNRVILATDGDFNVGISDRAGLQSLIEKEAKTGVFLSVLGYGMGNLKDSTMETLADKGNGNYAYIDSLGEARKVLSEEMASTLVTVAKDVKIQIEFNPSKVRAYKLLGYENRMLAKEDFNDDKKDAGEMGAGHTVTALYEITPSDAPLDTPPVDPLKYQSVAGNAPEPAVALKADSPEIMTVKLRYKAPDADVSQLMELPVIDKNAAVATAPGDFQFATAVAGYGLLLRGSKQVGKLNWDMIRTMAKTGKGEDPEGYRGEFLQLIDKAAGAVPIP